MKLKPLVYLVEDDADDQYMFKMLIKDLALDIDVCMFENGFLLYEALTKSIQMDEEAITDLLPDIILLDLNLPVWDGKKTLRVIKKDERLKQIPIVIYSTSKSEYDINECYVLGANSFITKAAEFEKIQDQIKQIFTYWFSTVSL